MAWGIVETELAYCSDDRFNQPGVPLDSGASFAEGDWLSFVGAMMGQAGFLRVTAALRALLDDTPQRAPWLDWCDSVSGEQREFRNRAVVGSVLGRVYLGY